MARLALHLLLLLLQPEHHLVRAGSVEDGDLVGHWRFDDVTGTRHWHDESSFGNPLVSRKYGTRYEFAEAIPSAGLAGSGGLRTWSRSHAVATNVPVFKTISFWARRDAGCCEYITNWLVATIDGEPYLKVWVHNTKLFVQLTNTDGRFAKPRVALPVAAEGAGWDHIAAVVTDTSLKLFLNGHMVQSRDVTGFDTRSGSVVQFRVGTGDSHNQYLGMLDEIRLYDRGLQDAEVAALAAAESTGGVPPGENLPPRADAGPVVTVWKPGGAPPEEPAGMLEGSCVDPEGSTVSASWRTKSGPDLEAVAIAVPSSATTPFSLAAGAPTGDYVLELSCSDGALVRTADLVFVVFDAHEDRVGATIETLGPSGTFADAGKPATPVGLWLFDGDLSNSVPSGSQATLEQVSNKPAEHSFVAEGRFGGALRLECESSKAKCVQLGLGNPEPSDRPWPAMSASVWFKAESISAHGVQLLTKGTFQMPSKFWKSMQPGSWHHFVIAQDPDIYKVYLDGSLAAAIESGVADRNENDTADDLTFGTRKGTSASSGLQGLVDEIAVFDFVLSNEEVEVLYTQGAQAFTARRTMNPYSRIEYNKTMMEDYFPESTEEPDYAGYVGGAAPSYQAPPAYVHPRIFFAPDELPALRKRYASTTAGRVMMEHIRGLLEYGWEQVFPWWRHERNATEEELYHPENSAPAEGGLDALLVLESFRCLIDGDSVMAARVGEQLDAMADLMQPKVEAHLETWHAEHESWRLTAYDGIGYDQSGHWAREVSGTSVQVLMLRGTTVAYCYDLVYPWLQEKTRDKVRKLIATATQGTWSIGMDAVGALPALGSNWVPWVTGDLAVTILAIEGEDGFDSGVFARAAKAIEGFARLGVSEASGAPYAGMGKNSIITGKMMALAKHGHPRAIAGPGVRKHVSKWLLHTMLPNGLFFKEDKWGGVEAKPRPGDIAALKLALPDDKAVDWVWRNAAAGSQYAGVYMGFGGGDGAMPYRSLAPFKWQVYDYDFLSDLIYVEDWQGPADSREHAEVATAGEPLTYVAADTGQLVTRSAWADDDAAWLLFNVRCLPGDHASRARGEFVFHAIGETWAFYHTNWNEPSEMHSVILVDNQGQGRYVPGKFVEVRDSPEATFASMDARENYGIEQYGGGFGRSTVNSYMLEPLHQPWGELLWRQLPNWYAGTGPDLPYMKENGERQPPLSASPSSNTLFVVDQEPQLFAKAYRTVGLVRSANPYALVLDDIQQDDQVHEYAWRMPIRDEYYRFDLAEGKHEMVQVNHSYFQPDGGDFVLRATGGGPGRLLVRLLESSSPHSHATIATGYGAPNSAGVRHRGSALQVTASAVSARFRMLLWPLKDENSPLPTTTWDEASSTLTVDDDQIVLSVSDAGATTVQSLTVRGANVSNWTMTVADEIPSGAPTVRPGVPSTTKESWPRPVSSKGAVSSASSASLWATVAATLLAFFLPPSSPSSSSSSSWA